MPVEPAPVSEANASQQELALLSLAFAPEIGETNLRTLLSFLNDLTTHRFTGVYRFEPGWVMSVALWDRENPAQLLGANVKMKESYCWLTGLGKDSYIIEDACSDARLDGHAAREAVRSYCAVMLRDTHGTPWGTLCHFDFAPRQVEAETLSRLEAFRPLVEEILVRDCNAHWDPDAPSVRAEPGYDAEPS
jgi:hypothetical protein